MFVHISRPPVPTKRFAIFSPISLIGLPKLFLFFVGGRMKWLAVFLFVPVCAFAKFKSEGAVDAQFESHSTSTQVSVHVKKGFHINEKAPNHLILPDAKSLPPTISEPQMLVFSIDPKTRAQKGNLEASIYVCDDANTVCENRTWSWETPGLNASPNSGSNVKIGSGTGSEQKIMSSTTQKLIKDGFYLDDFERGLKECKKSKKPILVDFSARWCPGCMRLDKEVWPRPEMKKTLQQFIKVKLDADRFANKALMDKYQVGGIPAMLILNCAGEEMERFVDFQEARSLKKNLENFLSSKNPLTKQELTAKAKAGDEKSATALAQRAANSYKFSEALTYYALVKEPQADLYYWQAQVGEQTELNSKTLTDESKKKLTQTLQDALTRFPQTMSSLDWSQQLAELQTPKTDAGRVTLQSLVAKCDALINDKAKMKTFITSEFSGDYQGIESLKVYEARAEALESLDQKEEVQKAWKAAVAEGNRLQIKDEAYGPYFRFLGILNKAGEKDRIKNFYETQLVRAPKDGELNRRYARFLFEQGQYDESARRALLAIADSYDRNEIFAASVYVKSLNKLRQQEKARQFLRSYEARTDLPESSREELAKILLTLK